MEQERFERLLREGAQRQLGEGSAGIAVSLQYLPALGEPSRQKRKQFLEAKFKELASALEMEGGSWDPGSLSVSGQTVEAVIPVSKYEALVEALKRRRVRVDPLVERQVLQPV
jgi:hypothetical protein